MLMSMQISCAKGFNGKGEEREETLSAPSFYLESI